MQLQVHEVRDAAAGEQEQVVDRCRSHILPQLDLPQQTADLAAVQTLWGKLHPAKFFDLPGRI